MGMGGHRSRGGSKEGESNRSRHSQREREQQTNSTKRKSHGHRSATSNFRTDRENPEVPTYIGRENERSLCRSKMNAADDSRLGDTQVPDSVRDVISSPGSTLDGSIQRAMEDRMGDSLGDVRVHTGPQAAEACDDISARAFTVGNHVAFNSGEYDPESAEGQHVLAHELAHVRQQTGGAVSMLPQEDVGLEIDPDPALEREAEETAQRVMEGGELGIQRMSDSEVHVQRMPGIEKLREVRGKVSGSNDGQDRNIPADPEVLAKEVQQIKQNQEQVLETLSEARPGAPTSPGAGGWATTATKGVAGSLASAGSGAALGMMAGSAVPGIGTAVGAAAGAVTGMVGDLTKKGIEYGADRVPGSQPQELDEMYTEIKQMYKELKEGRQTGSQSAEVDY